MPATNDYGQPVGHPLGVWNAPPVPPSRPLVGRTVTLEPLDPGSHGPGLFEAFSDAPDSLWTYLSYGPFRTYRELRSTLDAFGHNPDWVPFAILVEERALGFASYLRIKPRDGVIEVGSIAFSPQLQNTTPATEAIYLMIRQCFDLGYRRCEWKCDNLNEPSRRAAERLGFRYEGTFRQATMYKGRNRDTAWYAIADREWPALDGAFQRWLSAENFTDEGIQRRSLADMREKE